MQEGWPNIAILDLSKAISRKRCKTGGKLVLITNRKSYVSFRLVPKSVTSNDLERRNGPYFALFHQISSFWGALRKSGRRSCRKKFTFAHSHLLTSFLFYWLDVLQGHPASKTRNSSGDEIVLAVIYHVIALKKTHSTDCNQWHG